MATLWRVEVIAPGDLAAREGWNPCSGVAEPAPAYAAKHLSTGVEKIVDNPSQVLSGP